LELGTLRFVFGLAAWAAARGAPFPAFVGFLVRAWLLAPGTREPQIEKLVPQPQDAVACGFLI